ncbi:hypothetical protein DAPPUDRAFT_333195 [Daphnia pulex]|uniref:Uncharacterized protein n=1 Tax=Daphnia pulex TaxID=6669 RepID=E9HS59_DAPPU|nr:hypothetical protein DAPPUDRAFT_333195 [Daphnia pulex]|eukprot:EFX65425.1 hypothetical protein DAPPUDRAFT_333195 [Daphnia pulex]
MSAMTPRFTVGIGRAFGRKPCKEPVPFQDILPLKLKDSVSRKGCCLPLRNGCDVSLLQETRFESGFMFQGNFFFSVMLFKICGISAYIHAKIRTSEIEAFEGSLTLHC